MKFKRAGIGTKFVVLVLLVASVTALLAMNSRLETARADLSLLSGQVQSQREANAALTEAIENRDDPEQIANIAHAETGVNIFHKAKAGRMKKYLEDDPYIIEATVAKSFPDTIVITVKERRQVGAIVYGDEFLIIDVDGYLIRRTRTQPRITIIKGLTVNSIQEGERIGTTNPEMFQDALNIIAAMEAGDVYFMELEMSEITVRAHIYDALICVGSADQIVYAIEQGHLQQILETLFGRGIKRGTINITDEGFASFSPVV